jgi:hypothetical protein
MAGHFEGDIQVLHYGRRRRRGRWARHAERGIPGPRAEGSSGRLRIDAVLECDEDWVLLHEVIQVIGQHFLVDHHGRVSRKEAMVVTGDPREANLFGQMERLARQTGAQDGWLITHASWSGRR